MHMFSFLLFFFFANLIYAAIVGHHGKMVVDWFVRLGDVHDCIFCWNTFAGLANTPQAILPVLALGHSPVGPVRFLFCRHEFLVNLTRTWPLCWCIQVGCTCYATVTDHENTCLDHTLGTLILILLIFLIFLIFYLHDDQLRPIWPLVSTSLTFRYKSWRTGTRWQATAKNIPKHGKHNWVPWKQTPARRKRRPNAKKITKIQEEGHPKSIWFGCEQLHHGHRRKERGAVVDRPGLTQAPWTFPPYDNHWSWRQNRSGTMSFM